MKLNGSKQKKTRRRKRGSLAAAIICSILGIFILSAAAYTLWEKPPDRDKSGLSLPDASPATAATDSPEHAAEPSSETGETADD
ncbi:MAG: hypothetical protein EOM14_14235, partial [Clostridia bacterium]|nr:hypothetical protein [Clostridia bacterium]